MNLVDRPLSELPVLSKAVLMEQFDEFVTARDIRLTDLEAYLSRLQGNELFGERCYVAATAGTAGRRGVYLWNFAEWVQVVASYNRAFDWAGSTAGLTRRVTAAVVSSTNPSPSRCGSAPPSTAGGCRDPGRVGAGARRAHLHRPDQPVPISVSSSAPSRSARSATAVRS